MMKKKKNTKTQEAETRLIKFRVSGEEQDIIRLAAALNRTSMAEFARVVVMQEARRLTEGISLPDPES